MPKTDEHGMPPNEQIEMMRRASADIKSLRAQIARLAPKADAYDKLAIVIEQLPQRRVGESEDIAWLLDKRIAEIESAISPAPASE